MDLTAIQVLIGDLTNDPGHDRYTTDQIGVELDNTMDRWNIEARILKASVTITVVDGTRQYALSGLTGTPISITRVTHKGLELEKRSKTWMDLYSGGTDWTGVSGTPTSFMIEVEDPTAQYLTVYPTPTASDAGANLVAEYVLRHTSMSASTDVPFMIGTTTNSILRPYDWGVAYDAAARLLARDPSSENAKKTADYARIAGGVLAEVIQVFKAFEKEEPLRLRGGRYWRSGNPSGSRI